VSLWKVVAGGPKQTDTDRADCYGLWPRVSVPVNLATAYALMRMVLYIVWLSGETAGVIIIVMIIIITIVRVRREDRGSHVRLPQSQKGFRGLSAKKHAPFQGTQL
jgi:hypothetical protein